MQQHLDGDTQASVIGLGAMGAKLAATLLDCGYRISVWNRSPQRAAPLIERGATLAPSAAQAIASSPLTIMCVTDFAASDQILQTAEVEQVMRDRSLIQLTAGQGAQARQQAAWAARCGARYLAGGIQAWPRDIGKSDTVFLFSGDRAGFDDHSTLLGCLAGDLHYLGADAGLASILSLSLGSVFVGAELGFFEGAALALASGATIEEFSALALKMLVSVEGCIRDATRRIKARDFQGDQATIDVYRATRESVEAMHASASVQSRIRAAYYEYLEQAHREGKGSQDIAALFDIVAVRR